MRRNDVTVVANLARRLQTQIHYSILDIEQLERHVENPHIMKALYGLDLQMTILRRWVENLVILGGGPPQRQWTRPVRLGEVVQAAIAEVEQYVRVQAIRPIEGTLKGHAVTDVNHLLADLIENATNFSDPKHQVIVRVSTVRTGVAVEIEDHGLGFKRRSDLDRLNALLKNPEATDFDALLANGCIGLYVVAVLARQHGIAVELQTNTHGGTTAVVILPPALIGDLPAAEAAQPSAGPVPELTAAFGHDRTPAARPAPGNEGLPALPRRTAHHRDAEDHSRADARSPAPTAGTALRAPFQAGPNGPGNPTSI
jgi:signal transduction histidine kinase